MPRVCTICQHPASETINRALAAGIPFRTLAARFETSAAAIYRHKKAHLNTTIDTALAGAPPAVIPAPCIPEIVHTTDKFHVPAPEQHPPGVPAATAPSTQVPRVPVTGTPHPGVSPAVGRLLAEYQELLWALAEVAQRPLPPAWAQGTTAALRRRLAHLEHQLAAAGVVLARTEPPPTSRARARLM
jgi:hypothetical protein